MEFLYLAKSPVNAGFVASTAAVTANILPQQSEGKNTTMKLMMACH